MRSLRNLSVATDRFLNKFHGDRFISDRHDLKAMIKNGDRYIANFYLGDRIIP
jgi:hypothetical protein